MKEHKRVSPLIMVVLLLAVGLPLTYVVTAGPALGYAMNKLGHPPGPILAWIENFYDPALRVVQGTALEKPMQDYVFWWADLFEPKPPPDPWEFR